MITFFGILFILLTINALFLIFSVNGSRDRFKKPLQKLSNKTSVPKLLGNDYAETEYKEAV